MTVLLEVCIDSITSATAAKEGGADRLEVCSSLAVGGTTPSFGLVEQCVADIQLPVMMMIRPHDGGFAYDDEDIETMLTDIEVAKSVGAQGVVFGALTRDRHLHHEHCKRLLAATDTLETTFHRAFDVVADPSRCFDEIMELGFQRLLTSGQSESAEDGIPLISQLCQRAEDRIVVMAGAGINPKNAGRIVNETGVRELHTSASVVGNGGQIQKNVGFGCHRRVTSAEQVRDVKQAVAGT